jgi:hypothetical protein
MKKLSCFFYKLSSGWFVLVSIGIFLLFTIFVLPLFAKQAAAYSNGMGAPDTTLFYSGARLYEMAQVYGEVGRQSFIDFRWTYDLAFPVIYTLFLVCSISWLMRKVTPRSSKLRILNLFPLLAFILDLLENSATSLVMQRYPLHSLFGQTLAPIFSPLKWLAVGSSFLILLGLVLAFFVMKIRKRTGAAKM